MGLDIASVIVIHTVMMLAFSALFAAIYLVSNDWHFPWHFAAGFLLAPAVMVVPGLGEFYGQPALTEVGFAAAFIGPALMTIGTARLFGVESRPWLWLIAFAAFALLHATSTLAGYGMFGHQVILSGSVVAFSLTFIAIARHLSVEEHPLGRTLFIWIAAGTAIIHLALIPLMILRRDAGESAEAVGALMIIGMTVVTAFIATTIIIVVAERFSAEIRREARTDALTGLALRRVFDDQMDAELERWRRHRRPFALVLFDIDHFKQVNDAHGHDVGDKALRLVAECGRTVLRPNDLLARIGGDEFALILPESRLSDATQVAERLLTTLRATPLATPAGPLHLTGSFGVAATDCLPDATSELIAKCADQALYAVKRRGRNGVVAFDATLPEEATEGA